MTKDVKHAKKSEERRVDGSVHVATCIPTTRTYTYSRTQSTRDAARKHTRRQDRSENLHLHSSAHAKPAADTQNRKSKSAQHVTYSQSSKMADGRFSSLATLPASRDDGAEGEWRAGCRVDLVLGGRMFYLHMRRDRGGMWMGWVD